MEPAAPIDVYARVSRKGDKEQRSTTGQVQVCSSVLTERGLPAGEVRVDDGRSAWNPRVRRDGWDAIMTRLESGESGGCIVYDLSRFSRRPKDGERLIDAAERGLLILDSESEYDLTQPNGKKQFRDALNAAAYYSDDLQRKVKRGKKLKASQGKVDERRSFGFEPDGVTVRESEAAIIREMAARLLVGETQESLMAELRARKVPTVRGAAWGYTTFRQVMTRPRNAGYIVHNGEIVPGVRLPGEPILDEPVWRRIVALYAARKPGRPPSGRYMLTGIAICGQPGCGASLAGRPVTGTQRRQYWCKRCRKTFADVRPLEAWAGILAVQILSDPRQAAAIERAARETATERQRLEGEAAGIEATLRQMAERLGAELPKMIRLSRREEALARHDAICKPLDARLSEIDERLGELTADDAGCQPAPVSSAEEWTGRWAAADLAERRAIILAALRGRKLVVGPGQPARFDPARVTIR